MGCERNIVSETSRRFLANSLRLLRLTDDEKRSKPKTRDEQLVAALVSPFASSDIGLRLTSLFGDEPNGTIYVRSLLHVDGKNIVFKETAGVRSTDLDIIAIAIGDNGKVIDQLSYPQTVTVRNEDEYQRVLQDGLTYVLNFPIAKAGAYQMRVAVRDTSSERLGAAMQYVEVHNLTKNRLTLSGVVVSGIRLTNLPGVLTVIPRADRRSGSCGKVCFWIIATIFITRRRTLPASRK